jgi:hypothetical protein
LNLATELGSSFDSYRKKVLLKHHWRSSEINYRMTHKCLKLSSQLGVSRGKQVPERQHLVLWRMSDHFSQLRRQRSASWWGRLRRQAFALNRNRPLRHFHIWCGKCHTRVRNKQQVCGPRHFRIFCGKQEGKCVTPVWNTRFFHVSSLQLYITRKPRCSYISDKISVTEQLKYMYSTQYTQNLNNLNMRRMSVWNAFSCFYFKDIFIRIPVGRLYYDKGLSKKMTSWRRSNIHDAPHYSERLQERFWNQLHNLFLTFSHNIEYCHSQMRCSSLEKDLFPFFFLRF